MTTIDAEFVSCWVAVTSHRQGISYAQWDALWTVTLWRVTWWCFGGWSCTWFVIYEQKSAVHRSSVQINTHDVFV